MRIAIDLACRDKSLTVSDWRVLGAVLTLTSSYSRLEDEIYLAQLGAIANVKPRQVQRSVARLRERRILEYEGRRGPGKPGLFRLTTETRQQLATQDTPRDGDSAERNAPTSLATQDTPTSLAHYREGTIREETVVVATSELIEALRPLGHLTRAQLEDAARAWAETPEGVRDCIADALERGDRPAALFTSLIAKDAHRASKPRTEDVAEIAERWVHSYEASQYNDEAINDELDKLERRTRQTLTNDQRTRLLNIARELRSPAGEPSLARAGAKARSA